VPDEVTIIIGVPGSEDGCILRISNYRLRRVPSPGRTLRAIAERRPLVLCLGEIAEVFPRVGAAARALEAVLFAELCSDADEPPSEVQSPEELERQKRKEALGESWLEEMRAEEVSRVASCHLHLARRDHCAYRIDKCQWPRKTKPLQVVRLMDHSFEPRGAPVTLAFPVSGGDAWVVTYFSWCGVEMSGPPDLRYAELLKEEIAAMTADMAEVKRNTALLPAALPQLQESVRAVQADTEAIARGNYELRKENEDLRRSAANGLFDFVLKVDPLDFRYFAAIFALGDRAKAARELGIKERTFFARVESWPSKGPEYKRMFCIMHARKRGARRGTVRLPDSVQFAGARNAVENPQTLANILDTVVDPRTERGSYPSLLQDILNALLDMDACNWQVIRDELIPVIREDAMQ
jgi:hypothetical protein